MTPFRHQAIYSMITYIHPLAPKLWLLVDCKQTHIHARARAHTRTHTHTYTHTQKTCTHSHLDTMNYTLDVKHGHAPGNWL